MTGTHLSDQELAVLEAFLAEHFELHNSMPLDMVHGFLATVLSGPRLITIEEWLPRVLGDFESGDILQTEQISGLLIRLYNSILQELTQRNYEPLLIYQTEGVSEPLPLPYGWCEGYLKGWQLHGEEVFDQMLQDADAELMLAPIMVFLMYEEDQLLNPPDEQMHRNAVAEIGSSVQGIYGWWQERGEIPPDGSQ